MANPLWGAPRIHGELLKLGIDIAERTVSRLMPKRRPQPSQTWRTFLANHVRDLVSIDFFTVPTARLRVLFVLVVLAHHRRRVVHFTVTEHPTAAWSAPQLVDAFPDDSAPAYLLRDRDQVYGQPFRHRVKGLGIEEVLTAPHSPWQNPFAERFIGSIRRECLNHVLVLGERHLHRLLTRYLAYYHQVRARTSRSTRTHPTSGRSHFPRRARSCSSPKSAACTTATSATPRSPVSSVFRTPQRPSPIQRRLPALAHPPRISGTVDSRRFEDIGRPLSKPGSRPWPRIPNGPERVGRRFGEGQAMEPRGGLDRSFVHRPGLGVHAYHPAKGPPAIGHPAQVTPRHALLP